MDEFPSNANKDKEETEKRVEVVVQGATAHKMPWHKKMTRNIVQDDAQSVGGYILFDILLPALRDTISDAVSGGVDRLLFGDGRAPARGRSSRSSSSNDKYGHVDYAGISSGKASREISRSGRNHHDFREIKFAKRSDAIAIVNEMGRILDKFDVVSVADFYEMCDVSPSFIDNKWGWTELRFADVRHARGGGFIIELPTPVQID